MDTKQAEAILTELMVQYYSASKEEEYSTMVNLHDEIDRWVRTINLMKEQDVKST